MSCCRAIIRHREGIASTTRRTSPPVGVPKRILGGARILLHVLSAVRLAKSRFKVNGRFWLKHGNFLSLSFRFNEGGELFGRWRSDTSFGGSCVHAHATECFFQVVVALFVLLLKRYLVPGCAPISFIRLFWDRHLGLGSRRPFFLRGGQIATLPKLLVQVCEACGMSANLRWMKESYGAQMKLPEPPLAQAGTIQHQGEATAAESPHPFPVANAAAVDSHLSDVLNVFQAVSQDCLWSAHEEQTED
mmetsp:Transcript_1956/g.8646  ORF Transcript_1956/g.8646 Transcript_1956/m.8646 type:complete len:247 (+) Transcript_1956:654-1394(+)